MFHLLKDGCIRRAEFIWNNLIHRNPADAIVSPFLRYPVPDNPKPFLVNIFPLKRNISQLPLRFATEHGVKHGIFRFYNKPYRARPAHRNRICGSEALRWEKDRLEYCGTAAPPAPTGNICGRELAGGPAPFLCQWETTIFFSIS